MVDLLRGGRRILAVRLDNIGDVVMLGPALRALRRALPEATITLMASPAGAQVAPLLPWVDRLITRSVVWQDVSGDMPLDPERELALAAELRSCDFDAALIFTSFSQSPYPPAFSCYLAGIPLRIGESKEFGGSLLSHWFRSPPDGTHQVDRNLFLLEALGIDVDGRALELHVPTEVAASAASLLASVGLEDDDRYVLVAPGASCPARTYDPARLAEAMRQLTDRTSLPVVVVGSKRDEEAVEQVVGDAASGRLIDLSGQTSVPQLAAVIKRAILVITNNSGPLHLADAFRRPLVVLYSGTELEEQWRPRSSPAALLRRPTFCCPCYLFRCPYNMECLDVAPEEVVASALGLLEATEPAGART